MDIESHSINHKDLNELAKNSDSVSLNHEIEGSKKVLAEHGISANIFIYPGGNGGANPSVTEIVQKYYRWGRGAWRIPKDSDYNRNATQISILISKIAFEKILDVPEKLTIIYYHDICEPRANLTDYNTLKEQFEEQMRFLKNGNYKVVTLKEGLGN